MPKLTPITIEKIAGKNNFASNSTNYTAMSNRHGFFLTFLARFVSLNETNQGGRTTMWTEIGLGIIIAVLFYGSLVARYRLNNNGNFVSGFCFIIACLGITKFTFHVSQEFPNDPRKIAGTIIAWSIVWALAWALGFKHQSK